MSRFAIDLQRFAETTKAKADDVVATSIIGIAAELDFLSPVGDAKHWKHPAPKGYVGGHFRANWQLQIGAGPVGQVAGVDTTPKNKQRGGATTAKIAARVPEQAAGLVYYIANNVPYASALEYGHSRQAPGPGGIVGRTIILWRQIVAKAVAAGKV